MKSADEVRSSVHSGIVPADVRETDFIHARIRESTGKYETIQIWNLSPLGVELVRNQNIKISVGDPVDLQIVIGGRRSDFHGLVIDQVPVASGESVFGVRFLTNEVKARNPDSTDERSSQRWLCSEEHVPRAIAPAPGRFNEFVGFKIRDISRDGLLLTTQLANSFLIPGMRLNLSIHLPMVAETLIEAEIVRLRIGTAGAEEILEVGVEILNPSSQLLSYLGQYLVQFSKDSSVEDLVREGLVPENVSFGISFYPLKDESDFLAALELRRKNIAGDTGELISFADEQDRRARIVVGKIGKEVVATARVRYPAMTDKLLCEPGYTLPDSEGRIDELIEVSGLGFSIPSRFRNDAILALLRYICSSCTSPQRHKVLVMCEEADAALFRKAGWTIVNSDRETVLIADAYRAIQGDHVSPIYWNYIWRPVADYLCQVGALSPKGVDRIVLRMFRMFSFASKIFFHFKSRAAKIG